ncbi:aspartate aminotransferase family protein [Pelagibacterium montanilacus]|uniref:aspartate aminotransferase family protein n=1 Tax=Pelagibacterium montanilacus TaxID=2185280 RepID=UPI000F8D1A8D|nr:aminotransferase class III-fold pyridoxal phosphate-dependent enzyme [Pelagibacterium montanilacus]
MTDATQKYLRSADYNTESSAVIAGSVNSNVRLGGASIPLCFERAEGPHLYDIDGNTFIDYALGMGPTILGHAPKVVSDAVAQSLSMGQMFAGQHRAELELGKLLVEHIPSAERVRIGMTGSEVVQAALRVSRAHTGRKKFIKFEGQYHGWFDNVLISHSPHPAEPGEKLPVPREAHLETRGQSRSVLDDVIVLPWNDLDAVRHTLEEHGDNIAALITEPVMCNTGAILPRKGYLEGLRELTREHGVVLIFDEVITGFRLGLGGAQGRYGITPDLSTFAKAMANGFPIAALAGRRDLMDMFGTGAVNHSGTYNSNVPSVVASIATIRALAADNGAALARAEDMGKALMAGLAEIGGASGLQVSGVGTCFNTYFGESGSVIDYQSYRKTDQARQKEFLVALLANGIRPTARGTWFVSTAHDQTTIDSTLDAARKAL